ncbi:unnamed protein product [Ectocarpus fasciculatus]
MKTFLTSLGLDRYCKAFEEAEVDMGAVDVMEESDYAQLGVAKGPRLKMMNVLARSMGGGSSGSSGALGAAAAAAAAAAARSSSFTSGGGSVGGGSVGGGSNAGSVSAPSPEPRPSPEKRTAPSPLLSPSQWSFSVAPGGGGGGGPRRAPSSEGGIDAAGAGCGDVDPAATASAACSPQVVTEKETAEGASRDDEEDGEGRARGVGWVGGGVVAAAAGEEALSPPADVWVASALRNAEDVLEGGDGSP